MNSEASQIPVIQLPSSTNGVGTVRLPASLKGLDNSIQLAPSDFQHYSDVDTPPMRGISNVDHEELVRWFGNGMSIFISIYVLAPAPASRATITDQRTENSSGPTRCKRAPRPWTHA
jgi:hypothetical protein